MDCKFCGKKIDDHAVFCPYCGERVSAGAAPSHSKPDQATKRKILLGGLGAALLVLFVVIAVAGNHGGNEAPVKAEVSAGGYTPSSSQGESTPVPTAAGAPLPDPEAYSGGVIRRTDAFDNHGYLVSNYSLPASEFQALSDYVAFLQQQDFALRDSEQGASEYENRWVFDYTGDEELELFTMAMTEDGMLRTAMAVYLSSMPMEGQDTVAVGLSYAFGLSMESTGQPSKEEPSATASAVPLPDPARYFADWDPEPAQRSKDGSDYTVSVQFPEDTSNSDSELETVLTAYLGLLEEYGFESTGEEEEGESRFYFFSGGEGTQTVSRYGFEEEPASVVLTYHSAARLLMVHHSAMLKVDESSPRANLGVIEQKEKTTPTPKATAKPKATKKPAATPKPTEKPKASGGKAAASSVQIPDFGAFSGIDLKPTQEKTKGKSTEKDYVFQVNEKIIDEYLQLLTEQYNFKVRKDSDNVIRTVTLDYTGTGSVSTFDVRKQEAVSVYLWAYHIPDTEFHITYGDGLEYTDTGDRTAQTIKRRAEEEQAANGGSNDDDDSTWKGSVKEVKCTKCHGEKTVPCGNCDGKGYKEKVVESPNFGGGVKRTTVKEKCYKCSNGRIECPRCHGTGKQ